MSKSLAQPLFLTAMGLVLVTVTAVPVHACTLWAATGESTKDGGTIVAKNRDWKSNQYTEPRLITSKGGFCFLGLIPFQDGRRRGVAAGINEKGLVTVSASASSVPGKKRRLGATGFNKILLRSFDSVEAVLKRQSIFRESRPVFYLIADRSKMALIEIAPRGVVAARVEESGILFHTNQYIEEKLLWANEKIGRSSQARLNRIRHLLRTHTAPFTIEDFIAFSQDRNDGPDNSIWRTGSTPEKWRTLAAWIVSIPRRGYPELYVKLANPDEPQRAYRLKLDPPFWRQRSWADAVSGR